MTATRRQDIGTAPPRFARVRKRYVALMIVVLLVGWVGWKVLAIMSARPGPLIDYTKQLVALSEKHQPEGENGWPALVAALERFDAIGVPEVEGWPTDPDTIWRLQSLEGVWQGEFDRDRLQFELEYLRHIENSGVLEELDAALTDPRFVRTDFPGSEAGLIVVDFPESRQGRRLGISRRAAMRVALESDDVEQFVRSWERLAWLARALSFNSFLVSGLSARSILEAGLDEMAMGLTEHRLDEATCRRILNSLGARAPLAPLETTWESERLFCYDAIQRTHTDDGRGNGILQIKTFVQYVGYSNTVSGTLPGGSTQSPVYNLLGLRYATRSETTYVIDRFFDAAVEQSRMPRSARAGQPVNVYGYDEILRHRHAFARLMLTATGSINDMRDCTESRLAAIRILLAIEMFEDRHERLPQSLDDLVPDFLAVVPADPVSERPFVFQVREVSPDDPRSFWLYSIGLDGEDNAGIEFARTGRRREDALQDERDGKGFDYIFNCLREPVEEQ